MKLCPYSAGHCRERNTAGCTVDWRFMNADTRIKLKRLHPSIQPG